MNAKLDKLISFYKDKSISQEEKRTVAIKIVDNLLASGFKNETKSETKNFILDGKKYENVGINIVYDLFKKHVRTSNIFLNENVRLEYKLKEKSKEIEKLEEKLVKYKAFNITLIIIFVIMVISTSLIFL